MNKVSGNINLAKRISALLILSCYVLIFFQVNLIHHFHHDSADQHHVHHDSETEQDACHRAIYHQDLIDGCAHDAHILAQSTACEFCDSLFSQSDLLEDLVQCQQQEAVTKFNSIVSHQFRASLWYNDVPLRGPPSSDC